MIVVLHSSTPQLNVIETSCITSLEINLRWIIYVSMCACTFYRPLSTLGFLFCWINVIHLQVPWTLPQSHHILLYVTLTEMIPRPFKLWPSGCKDTRHFSGGVKKKNAHKPLSRDNRWSSLQLHRYHGGNSHLCSPAKGERKRSKEKNTRYIL